MKTIRIPYKKIKNFILIKEIFYSKKYKKVIYSYEEYKNKEFIKSYKHRCKNPAVIIYTNNKINEIQYWQFGKLHRQHGPAVIVYIGKDIQKEEWYHKGVKLTEEDIEQEKKYINRIKKTIKLMLKLRK